LGAAVGLAHAIYLWRVSMQQANSRGTAIYRGVWAIGLWTLFGTYVLGLWIVGLIAYGLAGFRRARREA
jgi:uncharacterized paraquat-inducible protein A